MNIMYYIFTLYHCVTNKPIENAVPTCQERTVIKGKIAEA